MGSEDVDLILCDGATLTISDALTVENDAVLNLYFQSNGTGKLTVGNSTGTVTAPAGEMKKTTGDSSTTFEKCKDHLWTYTNNGENHTTRCDLCGKDGGAVNHSYSIYSTGALGSASTVTPLPRAATPVSVTSEPLSIYRQFSSKSVPTVVL